MESKKRIKPKELLKTPRLQNEFLDKVRAIIFKRLKGNTYYEDQVVRKMTRDDNGKFVLENGKKINSYVEDILNTTIEKLLKAGVESGNPFMERTFEDDDEKIENPKKAIEKLMRYVKLTVASAHSDIDLELGIRTKKTKEEIEAEIKAEEENRKRIGEGAGDIKVSNTKPQINICVEDDYIEGSEGMTEESSEYQPVKLNYERKLLAREPLIEIYNQIKKCFDAVYDKLKTKEDQCFFYHNFWLGVSLTQMEIAESCGKVFNSLAAISSFFVPKVKKITECLDSEHSATGKSLVTLTAGKWTEAKRENLFELKLLADDNGMDI